MAHMDFEGHSLGVSLAFQVTVAVACCAWSLAWWGAACVLHAQYDPGVDE